MSLQRSGEIYRNQARLVQIGAHLSGLDIGLSICLRILNRLLCLCMRLGLRLCLRSAPAIVVRVPGKHGIEAEAACSAIRPVSGSHKPLEETESNTRMQHAGVEQSKVSPFKWLQVHFDCMKWLLVWSQALSMLPYMLLGVAAQGGKCTLAHDVARAIALLIGVVKRIEAWIERLIEAVVATKASHLTLQLYFCQAHTQKALQKHNEAHYFLRGTGSRLLQP